MFDILILILCLIAVLLWAICENLKCITEQIQMYVDRDFEATTQEGGG